jgi:hypothetical protein
VTDVLGNERLKCWPVTGECQVDHLTVLGD